MFLVLALSFRKSLNIKVAEATAPTPAWWVDNNGSFSQYDTYQFNNGRTHQGTFYSGYGTDSNIISTNSSYDGVAAIGPTGTIGGNIDTFFTTDANATDELEWQCPELVKRFLYLEYGTRSIVANGSQVVENYTSPSTGYPSVYRKVPNDGSAQIYPKAGDVLSYGPTNNTGHTALVQSVTSPSNGGATVQLIEQNASSTGITNQDFSNWQFQNGIDNNPSNTNTVSAWLTPRTWSNVSGPSVTGSNYLQAVTSTSSSDVWTVGYNYNSVFRPLASHWNGSSWGSNAISSSSEEFLYGVSAISSSNILAVGSNADTGHTVAYHYDGSSWSSPIPSDNPGSSPTLTAVASDSSGDAWAVGQTYSSGTIHIVIEKYEGASTGFQNWTLTGSDSAHTTVIGNLSSTTNNELNAVTVYSSTDAWAVGFYYDNSGHQQPLTYHWDGSSWTNETASSPTGSVGTQLSGVTEVSASDVWAVGSAYNSSGTALHTYIINWDGSQWNIVSSASPTSDDALYAISAINDHEIYAVGITRPSSLFNPLVLRYNGNQWQQETVPTAGSSIPNYLYGVSVTSSGTDAGEAWAVGYYGSSALTDQLY